MRRRIHSDMTKVYRLWSEEVKKTLFCHYSPEKVNHSFTRYRRIGYNLNVMRQSACLVFNPIMVDNYAAFLNCTPVGRASDSMMVPT